MFLPSLYVILFFLLTSLRLRMAILLEVEILTGGDRTAFLGTKNVFAGETFI